MTQGDKLRAAWARGCFAHRRTKSLGAVCRGKVWPEYHAYLNAKHRCKSKKDKNYYNYGGRGIKFLYTSFPQFIQDVGRRPSSLYSLDRRNNDGNYEPGNCRWATSREQSANKRRPRACVRDLQREVKRLQRRVRELEAQVSGGQSPAQP